MQNATRELFNAYMDQLAELNAVPDVSHKFTLTEPVQTTLEQHIQESSAFLKKINVMGVTKQKGNKIGLDIGTPIASTDNTSTNDRDPKDPTAMADDLYECTQTNFDTALSYDKLDAWASFPNFQTRIRDMIVRRQALDRIVTGFVGINRNAASGKNNLAQVNVGWLQKYRDYNSGSQVFDEGAGNAQIRIDATQTGADYKNLDAAVFDAVGSFIDNAHIDRVDLVAVVGRSFLTDKYMPLIDIDQANNAENVLAADMIISQKRIGGLPAVRAPGFPDGKIFITPLSNLSIYWQRGARRRTILDNAKRDRIENYESSNDSYVVEDYKAGVLVESIATWNGTAWTVIS